MTVTKISISLDRDLIRFVDAYAKRHAHPGRSGVAVEALKLMRQREELELESAYASAALADRAMNAKWSGSDCDGLMTGSW